MPSHDSTASDGSRSRQIRHGLSIRSDTCARLSLFAGPCLDTSTTVPGACGQGSRRPAHVFGASSPGRPMCRRTCAVRKPGQKLFCGTRLHDQFSDGNHSIALV